MLVLSRKPGEKVVIGAGITITILESTRGRVRIGIEAPENVPILRGELACWLEPSGDELAPLALPVKG
jgi:carbon storage regulator